ncbi:MAG: hypothetical protein C0605_09020 [Hyphomicrobiales bacterium]|nr:MAG: hypothetical protein C0605_09020 [Hyphomicrobiales bacterium]
MPGPPENAPETSVLPVFSAGFVRRIGAVRLHVTNSRRQGGFAFAAGGFVAMFRFAGYDKSACKGEQPGRPAADGRRPPGYGFASGP